MSIHHNINIPAVDIERLWGASEIKLKQTNDPECRAYWYGVANVFELLGMPEPPSHNAFVAELEARFDEGGEA